VIDLPPVLLPYQARFVADRSPVIVYEKSRRIGLTWGAAYGAVEAAAATRAAGGMDVLYIGYNLEMAREFIGDCAFWARHLAAFAGAVPDVEELVFKDRSTDGDRDIQAFRIKLASGFEIVALSSQPRSLRGKQGLVIIDEAAFHDDLREVLKAAMALLIWGGRVWVISTHDGADNPFNELVEDVRAGRKPYRLYRTTFMEAVDQGLYRRVCLSTGRPWSEETERAWIASIYAIYRGNEAEELDCIPAQGSGVWLTRALIDACMNEALPVVHVAFEEGFELQPDHVRKARMGTWIEERVDPLLARLDELGTGFLGGDFARSGDLTVLAPGQIPRGQRRLVVPFLVELRNCPFAEQQQLLFHLLGRLPRFAKAALDARGLGAQLAELAMQRFGATRVERVLATREWYRETMPGLKARFEDRTIEIPRDEDVRQDLRSIQLDKGIAMLPEGARSKSIRGGMRHGDAAIALALLQSAATGGEMAYDYKAAPSRRAMPSDWRRDDDRVDLMEAIR
jgi:phage FluMu gp28-like protein